MNDYVVLWCMGEGTRVRRYEITAESEGEAQEHWEIDIGMNDFDAEIIEVIEV